MQESLANVSKLITEVWLKLNPVQRAKLIFTIGFVSIVFFIIIYVASRPEMVNLTNEALTPEKIGRIETALSSSGMEYEISSGFIKVKKGDLGRASVILKNEKIDDGFTYTDAFNSTGIGRTNVEIKEMLKQAKETEIEDILKEYDAIYAAKVQLNLPDDTQFFIDTDEESSASVQLTLRRDLNKEQISAIVNHVARSSGVKKDNISMSDHNARLLYSGDSEDMQLTAHDEVRAANEDKLKRKVKEQLTGIYQEVVVGVTIEMDFDKVKQQITEYSSPIDGSKKGLMTSEDTSKSSQETTTGSGETGLGANDGTGADLNGSSNRNKKDDETKKYDYVVNSTVSEVEKAQGIVKKDQSSIAITAYKYEVYDEEIMETRGELADKTWNEFKLNKQAEDMQKMNVDDGIVSAVRKSTGINDVVINAYVKPIFVAKMTENKPVENYIFLGIMFILVTVFVYALIKKSEPDEIIAVDSLLSTRERQVTGGTINQVAENEEVEAIEVKDSRVKRQVEKFVDEKPEAVAQLLKNWLSDEWE
ncbi:MAG: hypothetical protein N4A47_06725 [Clostridia bacterium]|jgi:flagellar M-ring protein FliF|nr:hypothetical protein [Clostridia bacterium]